MRKPKIFDASKIEFVLYLTLSNYSNLSKYNYIKVDMNHFYLPWPSFWPMKICLRKYMRILTSKARSCCSACAKVVTMCFKILSCKISHVTQLICKWRLLSKNDELLWPIFTQKIPFFTFRVILHNRRYVS